MCKKYDGDSPRVLTGECRRRKGTDMDDCCLFQTSTSSGGTGSGARSWSSVTVGGSSQGKVAV